MLRIVDSRTLAAKLCSVIQQISRFKSCRRFKSEMTSQHQNGNCPTIQQYKNSGEPDLYALPLKLSLENGKSAEIDAVFLDTLPHGSPTGTVVMIHGTPGSHIDFKYITPLFRNSGIRLIGVNFPGFGYSTYDDRLKNDNTERSDFIQQIIDRLRIERNLIFMGHSRGSENALRMAANNVEKTLAAILVNPIGYQKHKGVRPFWGVKLCVWLWENLRLLRRPLLEPLFYLIYKFVGIRVESGKMAAIALQQMSRADFGHQKPFVETLNKTPDLRAILLHSGRDQLVEQERSMELINSFSDCDELIFQMSKSGEHFSANGGENDEDAMIEKIRAKLQGERVKNLSIFFPDEDHFLQKHQAKLISETIKQLFANKVKVENNK